MNFFYLPGKRYFGLTYAEAFAGAIVHSWTFYGRELTRFHRIWIFSLHFPETLSTNLGEFLCTAPLADGFPFLLILHGSLLLGGGVFYACAFQSEPSVDSLFTRKPEKEALEKDHMQNGYLNCSESSLFQPMQFLGYVLRNGRHLIAICCFRELLLEFSFSLLNLKLCSQ